MTLKKTLARLTVKTPLLGFIIYDNNEFIAVYSPYLISKPLLSRDSLPFIKAVFRIKSFKDGTRTGISKHGENSSGTI